MVKKFFCSIGRWIKRHKVITVLIVIILIAAVIATFIISNRASGAKVAAQGVKQNTVELTKTDLTSSVSATGTIESADTMTVSTSVSNVEITAVNVSEGDTVNKGDTLVTFDQEDLQESYDDAVETLLDTKSQAASELESAQSKLTDAKETYSTEKTKAASNVASAKSEYTSAKSKVTSLEKQVSAAKDSDSKTKLQEQLTQAQQSLTQAKNSYENAVSEQTNTNKQNKSSINSAKQSVTTTKNNNKKSIKEAQRSVDDAKESLDACSVTAPMSGTVTAVGVSAGDTYSGGDMFEISDCTQLQVTTSVDEYDINNVKKGQKVVILTDATDEDEIEGEITFVAPTTGSSSLSSSSGSGASSSAGGTTAAAGTTSTSSTSGYSVTIKIKTADERLKVGMTAKCSIILEEVNDVFAVPYDAVHTNNNGDSVIYVSDETTKSQKQIVVTKGMESDYYIEVQGDELTEGLNVIIPTDDTSTTTTESSDSALAGMMGGMSGGNRGNKMAGGDMGARPGN